MTDEGRLGSPFLLLRVALRAGLRRKSGVELSVLARNRAFAVLIAIAAILPAAQAADQIDIARRMAQAGALDLSLARVEQNQPPEISAPSWIEWELLRLDLLSRKGRDAEILQRIAGQRARAMPDAAATSIFHLAARSALRLNRPADARGYLARVLLRTDLAAADYRDARLTVIDSYLAERDAALAFQVMLRFQQDFAPLRREEAERFAAGLVVLDRAADAAGWLAQLDQGSPTAVLLRLRAGLIKPEAAIAQARSLITKGIGEPAWTLLSAAGAAQRDRAIEIEVAELRLNSGAGEDFAAYAERSASLWKLYAATGQSVANELQLLSGDDAAWFERAGRIHAAQPRRGRALLGTLMFGARAQEIRAGAALQLIASLKDAKLALTALRLFADPQRFVVDRMDPRVRLQLGALAAEQKLPAEAARYWQKLPVPAGMSAEQWQLRYIAVLFQAGMVEAGLGASRALLKEHPVLAQEHLRRMMAIAGEALDAWHVQAAAVLYGMLLSPSTGVDRITVLLGLGRARELAGEFRAAADAFLSAALLASAPESDRDALKAREAAAINLARAGMRDDARALWQWLARNAKDAALRDNAVRALKHW